MIILNLFFQVQSSDVESEEKRQSIVRHPQQVPEQVEQSKPIEENTEGENPRPTSTKDDPSFEIHSSDDGRGKKLPHYGQKRFKKTEGSIKIVSIEFSNKNPIVNPIVYL